MKAKLIVACLILSNWAAVAQHDHAKHEEEKKTEKSMVMFKDAKLGKAYEHYLHLKDALVASQADNSKKAAGQLTAALGGIEGSATATEVSAKIANQSDLAEQRKLFSTLSNEMAALVKGGKLSMGMLYLEY